MKRAYFVLVSMVLFLQNLVSAQSANDSFHIYFRLGDPQLNTKARTTIDSLLYNDILTTDKNMLIVGYADYIGSEAHNDVLSKNRALHVQEYLQQTGVKKEHITLCIGKGEIARPVELPGGYASDRKVDIVVASKTVSRKNVPGNSVSNTTPIKKHLSATDSVRKKHTIAIIDSLQVGQTFILNNIYFYAGRHTIREESLSELDNLVNVLNDYPRLKISVEGHVCCVPKDKDALDEDVLMMRRHVDGVTDTYEMNALSTNRAIFIFNYLIKQGIAAKRLKFVGFAKTRPLVSPEKTADDENKNRRVEIRILEK